MFYDRLSYETGEIVRFRMKLLSSRFNVVCLVTMPWYGFWRENNPAFKVSHVINKKGDSHMILRAVPENLSKAKKDKRP